MSLVAVELDFTADSVEVQFYTPNISRVRAIIQHLVIIFRPGLAKVLWQIKCLSQVSVIEI